MLFALVEQRGIGKLEIALIAVPLAVEVKAEHPSALNGEAADQISRWQAVGKLDPLQVGDVRDIALGPPHRNQCWLRSVDHLGSQRRRRRSAQARLAVRPYLDLEVVGQHVVEVHRDNRRRVWTNITRIVEVVVDDNPLWTIRGQKARTPEPAEDDRPLRAGPDHLLQGGNRLPAGVEVAAGDPHVVAEQRRSPFVVVGRIVAQNHRNRRQRCRALSSGEAASN